MTSPVFDRATAERRLGPAAVKAIRECAAAAPPLTPEQGIALRALFEVPRARVSTRIQRAA
ncbi:hypothetical protein ABZ070_19385 [Streptomyces sp. NPDC006283]|uniref:hypothetical protein n=1 Tax=Streptomyces sp. NPDC006283 TaxID=3156741 RepID=UPI0033A1A86C